MTLTVGAGDLDRGMPRLPLLSASALIALSAATAAQAQQSENPLNQVPLQDPSYGGQSYGGYQTYQFPAFDRPSEQEAVARFAQEWGLNAGLLSDSIPAKGTNEAGFVVQARQIPAAPPTDSTLPLSTHYLSRIRADELAVATDPGSCVYATWAARMAPRHPHGEDHRVRSCAGYVYKRWYEYSRFEDAARTCGTDASCVFQVGTTWSSPGIASRPQLFQKAPGIHTIPAFLTPRSADPVDGFSPLPFTVKNEFFAVTPADILQASTQYALDPAFAAAADTLIPAVGEPLPYDISNKIAWHVARAADPDSAALTAVERKEIERRLTRYKRLVAEYRRLRALLPEDDVPTVAAPDGGDDEGLSDAAWGSMVGFLGGTSADAGPLPIGVPTVGGPGLSPEIVATIAYQAVVDEMADALMAEWQHLDVNRRLGPDGLIINDHGCLVGNACDWLPEMFAFDYLGRFQKEREADMTRCLQATSGVIPADAPWAADVVTMASHIEARIAALKLMVASLPFSADRGAELATGSRNIHWGIEPVSESKGIYGLLHGAYSHHATADLAVTFSGSRICALSAKVDAGIHAEFTAPSPDWPYLPVTHEIIDGALTVRVARDDVAFAARTRLAIDGHELFNFGPEIPMDGETWSAPPQSTHFTIYEYGVQFSILGVPAYLAVSVQGDLSFAPSVSVSPFDASCSRDMVAHPEILPAIEGRVDSSVDVDADGRLAIGVPGFSFGVNGHVDVLSATLPASARFLVVDDGGTPSLLLETKARLDATLLAGSLSVYAEALFLYAEKTIFGWEGIAVGLPIWNTTVKVPLTFLGDAFKPAVSVGGGGS